MLGFFLRLSLALTLQKADPAAAAPAKPDPMGQYLADLEKAGLLTGRGIYVTKAGEESRGLGLGLPLSRRLARLLGGELRAVAEPGKGGWFILEVPADAA